MGAAKSLPSSKYALPYDSFHFFTFSFKNWLCFEKFMLLCARNHPQSSVSRRMMDIFDELRVTTKYVEVNFNKDVIVLYVDAAEKLNKIDKLFR